MTHEQQARGIDPVFLRQQHNGGSCCYPATCQVLPLLDMLVNKDVEIGELLNRVKDASDETFNAHAQRNALVAALKGLYSLVEDGYLVRITTNDSHFPSYLKESARFVNVFTAVHAALAAGEGEK